MKLNALQFVHVWIRTVLILNELLSLAEHSFFFVVDLSYSLFYRWNQELR